MAGQDWNVSSPEVDEALTKIEKSLKSIMQSTDFVPNYVKKAQLAKEGRQAPRYASMTGPTAAAWLEMIGGVGIAALTVIAMLATGIIGAMFGAGASISAPLLIFLFALSALLFGTGYRARKKIKRFESYKINIGKKGFCTIEDLASGTGNSQKMVRKDLKSMMQKGWFLHGHMDSSETNMIVTEDAWKLCKDAEARHQQRMKEEASNVVRSVTQEKETVGTDARRRNLPKEVQSVIAEGTSYIEKIRKCNELIPDPEITGKLDRMETITRRIFVCLEERPGQVKELKKLMQYYLPTSVKLLESYIEIDAQPIQGETIRQTKAEIVDTLDTINEAYEKLLDSLYQSTSWDISADISVMKTMMAQEGLVDEELTPNVKNVAKDLHISPTVKPAAKPAPKPAVNPRAVEKTKKPEITEEKKEEQGITLQI